MDDTRHRDNRAPIDMMLDGVQWVKCHDQDACDGLYATHSGVWEFNGKQIRVYRLSDGRAIIDADDFEKILGIEGDKK